MASKAILIGKKVYEEYLSSNGDVFVYGKYAKNEGLSIETIMTYVYLYRDNPLEPKPTKDEEELYKSLNERFKDAPPIKNDYIHLDDLINAIIKAKEDYELNSIITKYEWKTISRAVIETLERTPRLLSLEDYNRLKTNYDRMLILLEEEKQNRLQDSNKKTDDRFAVILDDYFASSVPLPYLICEKYSVTYKHFDEYLVYWGNKSSENHRKYERYLKVKNNRVNNFIQGVRIILDMKANRTLTPLDISLITGLSLSDFANMVNYKEVVDAFSKKVCYLLYDYANAHKNDKPFSKNDLLKESYIYKGKKLSNDDYDSIESYLKLIGMPITYNNVTSIFKKQIDNLLDINAEFKKIELSKNAYEVWLESRGSYSVIMGFAKNNNLSFNDILRYVREYQRRTIEPKPSEEQRKLYNNIESAKYNNHIHLKDILNALINADTDEDLISILAKYDWFIVKHTAEEFIYAGVEKDELQSKVLDNLNRLVAIRQSKSKNVNMSDRAKNKVKLVLDRYFNSNEVYIDICCQGIYSTPQAFFQIFNNFKNGNEEEQEYYSLYLITFNERLQHFINKLSEIFESNDKLDVLDYEIIMGLDIQIILRTIPRTDIKKAFSPSVCKTIYDRIRLKVGSTHKYTREDAMNLSIIYNGREITNDERILIMDFLESHGISLTYDNISLAFNKYVNGKLSLGTVLA